MNLNKGNTIGEKIKAFRKAKGLSVLAFAEEYKLNKDNLYKWEKGTKPSDQEDYKKLESILNSENSDNQETINEPKTSYVLSGKSDPKESSDLSINTINSLVESNRILASNNTVIAESQLKLVETNSELAGMLKEMINKTNSSDLSGIQRVSAARLAALLEVIADLGIGKAWKSKQEGLAYLSKKFYKDLEAVG